MAGPSGNETNHQLDGLTIRGGLALVGAGGVTTYLNSDVAAASVRQAICLRAQGFYAETIPVHATSGNTAAVSGTLYGVAIGLLAGDVVTNLSVRCVTAGSVLTLVKAGIYSKAGVLLCSSADEKAQFSSAGVKTMAMTTPFTVTADDGYYASFLAVGTTGPAIFRGALIAAVAWAGVGSGISAQVTQISQTDFPTPATLISSSNGLSYWIGVS